MRRMKLTTVAIRKAAPAISVTSEMDPRTVNVVAKLFTPDAQWTWYITELGEDGVAFGLAVGLEAELGYFDLAELAQVRGPMGLYVERDLYFRGTLDEVLRKHGKADLADSLRKEG